VTTVLCGVLTLGAPGVSGLRSALPILSELAPRTLLIAVDADFREKRQVAASLVSFQVAMEIWPLQPERATDAADRPTIVISTTSTTRLESRLGMRMLRRRRQRRILRRLLPLQFSHFRFWDVTHPAARAALHASSPQAG
jgi:hypothetical protein